MLHFPSLKEELYSVDDVVFLILLILWFDNIDTPFTDSMDLAELVVCSYKCTCILWSCKIGFLKTVCLVVKFLKVLSGCGTSVCFPTQVLIGLVQVSEVFCWCGLAAPASSRI